MEILCGENFQSDVEFSARTRSFGGAPILSCRRDKSLLVLTRRYCVRDCSGNPAVALLQLWNEELKRKARPELRGKLIGLQNL